VAKYDPNRTHYVYGLHSGDGAIRYIGLTVNPRVRRNEHRSHAHLAKASNRDYAEWALENHPVQMAIISEHPDLSSGLVEEMRITAERMSDWNLLNKAIGRKTPTGPASPAWGTKHTLEWKSAMSKRMSGENHHFYGKKLSPEHRAKMGKPGSLNHNAILSLDDVLDVRAVHALGATVKDIATAYDVRYSTILRVVRRQTYVND